MADLTLGTLGLTSIFNTCITYFEYVQFGRSFGEDYYLCLLKIDIAKLRLCRWSRVVDDYKKRHDQAIFSEDELQYVKGILNTIINIFEETKKVSETYKSKENVSGPATMGTLSPEADLDPEIRQLHTVLRQLSLAERQNPNVAKKAGWALWRKKNFEKLIADVTSLTSELIALTPLADELEERCQHEMKPIDDDHHINLLTAAASKTDPMLESTLRQKGATKGRHLYSGNEALEEAMVRYGDEYGNGGLFPLRTPTIGHGYDRNRTMGRARVHYGDSFGGRSVFD